MLKIFKRPENTGFIACLILCLVTYGVLQAPVTTAFAGILTTEAVESIRVGISLGAVLGPVVGYMMAIMSAATYRSRTKKGINSDLWYMIMWVAQVTFYACLATVCELTPDTSPVIAAIAAALGIYLHLLVGGTREVVRTVEDKQTATLRKVGSYHVYKSMDGKYHVERQVEPDQHLPGLGDLSMPSSDEMAIAGSPTYVSGTHRPSILTFLNADKIILGHGALVQSGNQYWLASVLHVEQEASWVMGANNKIVEYPLSVMKPANRRVCADEDWVLWNVDPQTVSVLGTKFLQLAVPKASQGVQIYHCVEDDEEGLKWEYAKGAIKWSGKHGALHTASTKYGYSGSPLVVYNGNSFHVVGLHKGFLDVKDMAYNRFSPIGFMALSTPVLPPKIKRSNESDHRGNDEYSAEDDADDKYLKDEYDIADFLPRQNFRVKIRESKVVQSMRKADLFLPSNSEGPSFRERLDAKDGWGNIDDQQQSDSDESSKGTGRPVVEKPHKKKRTAKMSPKSAPKAAKAAPKTVQASPKAAAKTAPESSAQADVKAAVKATPKAEPKVVSPTPKPQPTQAPKASPSEVQGNGSGLMKSQAAGSPIQTMETVMTRSQKKKLRKQQQASGTASSEPTTTRKSPETPKANQTQKTTKVPIEVGALNPNSTEFMILSVLKQLALHSEKQTILMEKLSASGNTRQRKHK